MFSKYVLFEKGHLNKRASVWTPWTPPGSATALCVCVCVFVCPRAYNTRPICIDFCACYLWYGMANVDLYSAIIVKVSNALNTLVSGEKPGFRALSKGLIVLLCAKVVRQGVPDHGAVHSEWSHTHGPTFRAPRSWPTRPQWAC